jgi:molybdate transport system regulatory protein
MRSEDLDIAVSLRRGPTPRIGLERVALIELIDELGSISAAAKRLGLSYKGAWDIVRALNNLFETPLVEAAPGGRAGGAARVTPRGRSVAAAFRRVQVELDAALAKLEGELADGTARDLFWSLGMRTSARNALRGEIVGISGGAVNCEVTLKVAQDVEITAVITCRSADALDLAVGKPAIALIKSSLILLAEDNGLKTSARNEIRGVVSQREDGTVDSVVTLAIGGGKTLTASITRDSAEALEIAPGKPLVALIKAPHVILAVE